MNTSNINGIQEMSKEDMRNTDGGVLFALAAAVGFWAGVISIVDTVGYNMGYRAGSR